MTYLKYYAKEQSVYEKEHNTILTKEEIKKLIEGCCMHYDMPIPEVKYKHMKAWLGLHTERTRTLTFSTYHERGLSLLTVAHELGHHFDSLMNGRIHKGWCPIKRRRQFRKAHTKKHNECMKMILRYYERGNKITKYNDAPKILVLGEGKKHIYTLGGRKPKRDWKNEVFEI